MDAKKADSSKQVVHENKKNIQKGVERLERHSGSGIRGDPKKGGAGGKHTWGSFKDDITPVSVLDENDPNYDPEEEELQKEAHKGLAPLKVQG